MCCGNEKRTAQNVTVALVRSAGPDHSAGQEPVPGHRPARAGAPDATVVLLRYLAGAPVMLRGPSTGRSYAFSGDQPVQAVSVPDAPVLMQTGLFAEG